jgi:translin
MYHPALVPAMENAEKIFGDIQDELADRDAAREKAIHSSREVIRQTKVIIKRIHSREDVSGDLPALDAAVKELAAIVEGHPPLANSGLVEAAYMEAAETHIFWRAAQGQSLPTPEEIGVTPTGYLLGAADAVGELRRWLMDSLLKDDMEEAQRVFGLMEGLYDHLNSYNLPDGIVPLRRKQDGIRGVLDRTRSLIVEAVEKRR